MRDPTLWQLSEVQVTYHSRHPTNHRPKVSNSKDAEALFRANWSNDMELLEEFNVLFLTASNRVKGIFRASRGGVSGTVVDPKVIYSTALKGMAFAIIVAHNHPSGNLLPSSADEKLTQKLHTAGEVLSLPLLDHLILVPHSGYYSFSDAGRINSFITNL